MYGHSREKDFFSGILVGGTVATLACLLLTTKKGKEIQRQMSDWVESAEEEVKDTLSSAEDMIEDSAGRMRRKNSHSDDDKDSNKNNN